MAHPARSFEVVGLPLYEGAEEPLSPMHSAVISPQQASEGQVVLIEQRPGVALVSPHESLPEAEKLLGLKELGRIFDGVLPEDSIRTVRTLDEEQRGGFLTAMRSIIEGSYTSHIPAPRRSLLAGIHSRRLALFMEGCTTQEVSEQLEETPSATYGTSKGLNQLLLRNQKAVQLLVETSAIRGGVSSESKVIPPKDEEVVAIAISAILRGRVSRPGLYAVAEHLYGLETNVLAPEFTEAAVALQSVLERVEHSYKLQATPDNERLILRRDVALLSMLLGDINHQRLPQTIDTIAAKKRAQYPKYHIERSHVRSEVETALRRLGLAASRA